MQFDDDLQSLLKDCKRGTTEEDNNQLYSQVRAGDAAAKEQMVLNNAGLVLHYVNGFLERRPDCEHLRDDLVSGGFLALSKAVDKASRTEVNNITGYLYICIQNEIRAEARNLFNVMKGKAAVVPLPEERTTTHGDADFEIAGASPAERAPASTKDDPLHTLSEKEIREELFICCETEEDRQIVELRREQSSVDVIAVLLQLGRATVYRRLQAIRRRYDAR